MAGPERQRRLDLDADAVGRHAGAVMGAMHQEAPGRDRGQPGQARLDPIGGRNALEHQRIGDLRTGRQGDEGAHRRLVGRLEKVQRNAPQAVPRFGGARSPPRSELRLSASASRICRAVASLVETRAQKLASAVDIGGAVSRDMLRDPIPSRRYHRKSQGLRLRRPMRSYAHAVERRSTSNITGLCTGFSTMFSTPAGGG